MRITKKLITSIICLAVSLAFCVWAVFAWFSANDNVGANGITAAVKGPDITEASVKCYHLDDSGKKLESEEEISLLNPYYGSDPTAALIEISFKYAGNKAAPAFSIYLDHNRTLEADKNNISSQTSLSSSDGAGTGGSVFTNYLSNVADIFNAKISGDIYGDIYSKGAQRYSLVENYITKSSEEKEIIIGTLNVSDESETNFKIVGNVYTVYYIIDYNEDNINYIYANYEDSTNKGLPLNAHVEFEQDLVFVIEETSN